MTLRTKRGFLGLAQGAALVAAVAVSFMATPAIAQEPGAWGEQVRRLQTQRRFAREIDHSAAPVWCREIVGTGQYGGYMSFYVGIGGLSYYSPVFVQLDTLDANCEGTARFVIGPSIVPAGGEQPAAPRLRGWQADRDATVKVDPNGTMLVSGVWQGSQPLPYWVTIRTRQRQLEYRFHRQNWYFKVAAAYEEIPYEPLPAPDPSRSPLLTAPLLQPDPSVPPEIAAFSGRWKGVVHGNGRERIMVVIRITEHGAVWVMHAWDDLSRPEGFHARGYGARVKDGVLSFSGGDDLYEFTLKPDGDLSGIMFRNGEEQRWGAITMRRVL